MKKAFIKWGAFCAVGAGLLAFSLLSFMKKDYTWVFAAGFSGLFLISSAWKKIRLLMNAAKALREGRGKIEIFYRDKNLVESQDFVIPAGADNFWFYGYLPEKGDIKTFRWQGIKKVLENERELQRDDLLNNFQKEK